MSLADNAARAAGRANGRVTEPRPATPPEQPPAVPVPDIPEPAADHVPAEVPVHVAWSRVMGEVRAVAKDARVESGPARFNYRGVDDALRAFGPACRRHGVLVVPTQVEPSYRDTKTSKGNPARECTVVVTYRIIGPDGGFLEVQAAGESLDSGDKGSAKAQAVALRTLLFHAGLVPTQDTDPDAHNVERGEAPVRSAGSYRDEILEAGTSRQRMLQIRNELRQHRMLGAVVENETGDDEPIGTLIERVGAERFGG